MQHGREVRKTKRKPTTTAKPRSKPGGTAGELIELIFLLAFAALVGLALGLGYVASAL